MNVLCIDDERPALGNLIIKLISLGCNAEGFTSIGEALEYLKSHSVEAAFLDINMPEMNGLELARMLKEIDGGLRIVFVTGYSEYALDAFRQHASGYVMKPASKEELQSELEHIRSSLPAPTFSRLHVQCFGNFEVFVDDKPLSFSRSKAKELFAYLVYRRGAVCSSKELAAVLFEEGTYGASQLNYLQKIIAAMKKAFEPCGLSEKLFLRNYNRLSVNVDLLDCDYYRFLKWDTDAVNAYAGEFMAQYNWAEFVCGYLDQRLIP